jgi:hypothetical protein
MASTVPFWTRGKFMDARAIPVLACYIPHEASAAEVGADHTCMESEWAANPDIPSWPYGRVTSLAMSKSNEVEILERRSCLTVTKLSE